jgi:uncharacterized membrane protein YesL
MRAALGVLGRTLRDTWDAWIALAVLNILWLGMSITVVLMPPATVAMFEATHELAGGRTMSVSEFLRAVPRHFLRAWAWAALNLVVGVVLAVNLAFYARDELWAVAVRALFAVATFIWAVAQLLVWPYLFEQVDPSVRRAVRNSLLTVVAAPGFSLVLGVVAAVVVIVSVTLILPVAVFSIAFLGLLGSHAVRDRLVAFGKRPPPAAAEDD